VRWVRWLRAGCPSASGSGFLKAILPAKIPAPKMRTARRGGGESFNELLRWDIDTGWSGVRLGHTTFVVLNALKELCFFRFGEIVLRDHFSGALEVDL
jgi:hypothetical protein